MDFWDLTKLLLRRWYFAIPVLVLTAVASIVTLSSVRPNYIANAYVQLIPPTVQRAQPATGATAGAATNAPLNPWINLGLSTLANAGMVTLQDKSVLEALDRGGYSDSFTVSMTSANPMVTFEVTGTSEAQATGTAEQVVKRFEKNVADLQSAYGIQKADLVTTRRLDLGSNLDKSDSNVKRAVIAVAAVGLLFTVAWTVGLDALLRRRSRRRTGLPDDELPYGEHAPSRAPLRNDYQGGARKQPSQRSLGPVGRITSEQAGNGARAASRITTDANLSQLDHDASAQSEPMTSELDLSSVRDAVNQLDSQDSQDSPDATIVLPLSSQAARGKGSSDGEDKQRR